MQSTRITWVLAMACATATGACSMITGLNKDYTFDGEGGASGGDAGKSDGATTGDGGGTGNDGGGTNDGGAGREGGAEGQACTGEAPCTRTLVCCGNSGDPSLTCNSQHNCQGKKLQFDCTRSNDCGLQACCLQQGSGGLLSASCAAACSDKELCDLADPKCRFNKQCVAADGLPAGFGFCN